jgi:hypothetical protein
MNQGQQTRLRRIINLLIGTLAVLALIGFVILAYRLNWEWTGLVSIPQNPERRTVWDWLDLLIIPLVLALGALWFNNQSRKSEQTIAQERTRDDALRSYFDKMSELLLDKNLGGSDKGSVEQIVASARTLAVIRSLEGDQRGRKSQVIRFVIESNLIGKIGLNNTDLSFTELLAANLSHANLSDAHLINARLSGADLSHANLRDAKGWTNRQLAQALSLVGATMPDGTFTTRFRGMTFSTMTEEAWEEFKKQYRQ